MSQDLLKISVEAFEVQLFKIPSDQLVGLLKNIYELKWEKGKNWPDDIIADIERKETKINRELMRRKHLTKKEYADYFKFISDNNRKKKIW